MSKGLITPALLDEAYTYPAYRALIDELQAEGKTTGDNHSESYLHYTKMNVQRMKRLDRTTQLSEPLLQQLQQGGPDMIWLILTEAWCGDAAQNIPPLVQMAEASQGRISVKLILRDEYPQVMDEYLTKGGRSIPKLIALKADTLEELGTWGPRPQPVQEMVQGHKENPTMDYPQFLEEVQRWYAKDRTNSLQAEMLDLLKSWNAAPQHA